MDAVLYLGDYARIEIKVTFQNGEKDSKVIDAGESRNMAMGIVMLQDNPLNAPPGRFNEVGARPNQA